MNIVRGRIIRSGYSMNDFNYRSDDAVLLEAFRRVKRNILKKGYVPTGDAAEEVYKEIQKVGDELPVKGEKEDWDGIIFKAPVSLIRKRLRDYWQKYDELQDLIDEVTDDEFQDEYYE